MGGGERRKRSIPRGVVLEGRSSKAGARLRGYERAVLVARPGLLRVVEAVVGPDDAEDVVQETLLKVWRLTKRPPDDWSSWLFRAAMNTAKNHLRTRRNEPPLLSVDQILDEDVDE